MLLKTCAIRYSINNAQLSAACGSLQQYVRMKADAAVRHEAGAVPSPALDFSDTKTIFEGQSTLSLMRSWLVFRMCGIPAFVNNAGQLLQLSQAVLGKRLTMNLVKNTFFAHFCAGETDDEVQSKTRELESRGIGSILDYAAEDDVKPDDQRRHHTNASHSERVDKSISTSTSSPEPAKPGRSTEKGAAGSAGENEVTSKLSEATGQPVLPSGRAVARQYTYQTEKECDEHVKTFLSCIDSASKMPGQGFAAVKLTALGNPKLLERVSSAIREVRSVFQQFDADGSGEIDKQEFDKAYSMLLPDASEDEKERVFRWMDVERKGRIDYVAWCQRLSLSKMPEYASRIKPAPDRPADAWHSSLQQSSLTQEEVALVNGMRSRLVKLAEAAAAADVKLMIDAEHTYMQPAIDHLTMELMRKYNRPATGSGAIIYNTYQAYLKDTQSRLELDLERAQREGYQLAAKLVRGAYLEMERARAQTMSYPSPVWDTLEQTHSSYHRCMEVLQRKVQEGKAEVLLGTHNQRSVETAVGRMSDLGLDPAHSRVYFGQLLGMSDHLTQMLGKTGYHAYKYVPYGRVEQVIPYLLRRATENASVMHGTKKDLQLLSSEISRRAKAAVGLA